MDLSTPPNKLKSKTHKQLEAALKKATKDKKEQLTASQTDVLQKADQYSIQEQTANNKLFKLYKKLNYATGYKTVKGKRVETFARTKKTKQPNDKQTVEMKDLEKSAEKYASKYLDVSSSKKYKQAKAHYNKLNKKAKKAYNNLFKYETNRHVKELKAKAHATNYDDVMAPHAQIFETGGANGFTLYLFAQSENEANSSDITKYPTDTDDPIADHIRKSDKTLTVSGYLRGPKSYPGAKNAKLKSSEYYYQKLMKWETQGTQLSYRSNSSPFTQNASIPHIYMKHLYIQSLNKDLQQAMADSIKVDITLSFAYPATVLTSKRNVNAKGKKSKNGKYAGAKHVIARKGATYYQLAKQYGTTVKQLKKWNGATLKPGEKIQVTQGKLLTKPKRTSKSKIYKKVR